MPQKNSFESKGKIKNLCKTRRGRDMRARDSLKFLKVSRFLPRSWQQERKADTRVEGFRSIARKVQRRPEINSARKVAAQAPNISQARSLEIWKNFSSVFRVPPQKAEDENVVFKMNNSPVTFPPSVYAHPGREEIAKATAGSSRIKSSPRSFFAIVSKKKEEEEEKDS